MNVPIEACECGRQIIYKGVQHVIEAAIDEHGEQPAHAFLAEGLRARRGSDAFYDLLLVVEEFAENGTVEIPRQLNRLRDGIWELKAQKLRLPFYYSRAACATIRLTHGFTKAQQKTPLREIDRAKAIRREDQKR